MRLVIHRTWAASALGVAAGGRVVDVDDLLGDGPWTMQRLVAGGPAALERLRQASVAAADGGGPASRRLALARAPLLAPLARPGKIVAVGRNYREHAAEEGATVAPDPVLFTKYPSSIVGPGSRDPLARR